MLDSIYVAASGLDGHQRGLKVISNNVANMNSPGFKGSSTQFTDVFLQASGDQGDANLTPGGGTQTMPALINFQAGEIQSTGRDLDVALNGPGFLVVRGDQGQQLYTKAGRLTVSDAGKLITLDKGLEVLGYTAAGMGGLSPISVDGIRNSTFQATSKVVFKGNLSTGVLASNQPPDHTIDNVKVYDAQGALRTLKLQFSVKRVTGSDGVSTSLVQGTWDVKALEGTATVGTGTLSVATASGDAAVSSFDVTLTALNGQTNKMSMVLGASATTNSSGNSSSLETDTIDGNTAGTLSKVAIDASGHVLVTYTNTLTKQGLALAVAEFGNPEVLSRAGGALFSYTGLDPVRYVDVGTSTKLTVGSLELSNVDLTDQFSTMILVQRGFQASSQVLSTASEMIQSLYDIKSRR